MRRRRFDHRRLLQSRTLPLSLPLPSPSLPINGSNGSQHFKNVPMSLHKTKLPRMYRAGHIHGTDRYQAWIMVKKKRHQRPGNQAGNNVMIRDKDLHSARAAENK